MIYERGGFRGSAWGRGSIAISNPGCAQNYSRGKEEAGLEQV